MKIDVKGSTMVRPMAETPSGSLRLSTLDLLISSLHVPTVYFYHHDGAANFLELAALKAALSRALVEFYPIAGRLQKGVNDRNEINCNGEGVLFVEAECGGSLEDLGDFFAPRPDLGLIPAVDYSNGVSSYPLLLLQVTRFKCGGVCLGVAYEHHLSDGLSALHFINTWSDIARGVGISMPPLLDRALLSARNPPKPQFTHIEYLPNPNAPKHENRTSDQTSYSRFKLTIDHLNALKASCNSTDDSDHYSTYEVLAGHVWRCVTRARGLTEDEETKLYITTDGRSRLRPPLPQGYFGSAAFTAASVAVAGELRSNHVRFAAGKVRDALGRMDDEYLRSALDYLELEPDLSALPRGSRAYKSPNLGIISWARLPIYGADFGWGKPAYMGRAKSPSEGMSHVLPSPQNDDRSLFFAISLQRDHMLLFEKLLYEI